jgi:hypothetical protein
MTEPRFPKDVLVTIEENCDGTVSFITEKAVEDFDWGTETEQRVAQYRLVQVKTYNRRIVPSAK